MDYVSYQYLIKSFRLSKNYLIIFNDLEMFREVYIVYTKEVYTNADSSLNSQNNTNISFIGQ